MVLTSGVAAAMLAGCAGVRGLQHRTKSYTVSAQIQTLAVNAHVGGVHVTGGDSAKVSVTEHISFRDTAPVTTHRAAAGTLTLDSSCPAQDACSVGYDITVPRSMTVRVNDNVGTISLESLSGQVTAQSDAGDINMGSVSGPIEVAGHAGSILGQRVASAHVNLRMSAGSIKVTFSAAPATIAATVTVGSVTLRVPHDVPYAVDANASFGSTSVSVARSAASPHAITARVTTGSVTIEPAP
ncbi:MAG TPA: hypothetical protein VEC76_13265 [Streptosporangiaceae bacterium]|nr:hypothetical protein [Streptosporangiaceae bacterium]